MAKKLSKRKNIKMWKKGINNVKDINNDKVLKGFRGGIRLPE